MRLRLFGACIRHVWSLGLAPSPCGARVPNEGQLLLNMESSTTSGVMKLQNCFQIAEVTRPLVSGSRVCDQGLECRFNGTEARVLDKSGQRFVHIEDAAEAS